MVIDEVQLALPAGQVSGLLVPAKLAEHTGIPRTTLVRYLELLATVFLIKPVPAWSSGQTTRAIGTPKLAFVDTGIACHLIDQDAARLDEPDGAAGPVLENFVVMELARQLTWAEERGRLYHYRTKDKLEVDAVIETPDGRVIAVEVKAGATARTDGSSPRDAVVRHEPAAAPAAARSARLPTLLACRNQVPESVECRCRQFAAFRSNQPGRCVDHSRQHAPRARHPRRSGKDVKWLNVRAGRARSSRLSPAGTAE